MNNQTHKEYVCTLCPVHCHMTLDISSKGQTQNVYGIRCSRGHEYIRKMQMDSQSMLPSSVRLRGTNVLRLPVNTDGPIPTSKINEALHIIDNVVVAPPVKSGEIIVENILDTGVNVIATKSI